jgi:2-polyprenyl-3-methyl-5-hydroxy-6-metoxy-1,4-benzoquinol methylase
MDAFGKALYGYWKGDHKTKGSHARDDGLESECNIGDYFIQYSAFLNVEKKALEFSNGKILDIGCGAGRHELYLQSKGFDVLGIDSSKLAIEVCKGRGCKKCKVMDIFESDFKQESFDTILLMGTNIGMAGTVKNAIKLLRICMKITDKEGLLILTTKDVTARREKEQIEYNEKNIKAGKHVGERSLRFEYKGTKGNWFRWIHIDPKTLQEIASEAGWKIEKIFRSKKDIYSAVLKKPNLL